MKKYVSILLLPFFFSGCLFYKTYSDQSVGFRKQVTLLRGKNVFISTVDGMKIPDREFIFLKDGIHTIEVYYYSSKEKAQRLSSYRYLVRFLTSQGHSYRIIAAKQAGEWKPIVKDLTKSMYLNAEIKKIYISLQDINHQY